MEAGAEGTHFMSNLKMTWVDGEREPKVAPNPAYPKGVDLDVTAGNPGCATDLPYPAPRCGWFLINCERCGANAVITTAGRPDDPRSIKIRCESRAS